MGGVSKLSLTLEKQVSQKRLQRIITGNRAIRAGATKDPEQRRTQYEYDDYSGKMYYSKTDNMTKAEDKLFGIKLPLHNVQKKSNIASEPGYVYVIVGESVFGGSDVKRGRLYFEGNLLFTHCGEIESPDNITTNE